MYSKNYLGRHVIAVDAMGGDCGPESVVCGLSGFASPSLHFIVFGDAEKIHRYASGLPSGLSYEIRHTDIAVTGNMDVMSSIREGKRSSMGLAIQSVMEKEAMAVVSSGNTGLYMALAKIILKTIEGIDRPAIASVIPGKAGRAIFLDLGANAECDLKNLVDFAIMGEVLARSVFNKNSAGVALLNIGAEDTKGSRLIKKTAEILKETIDNYVGFVEGNDLCSGNVDVVVTDGFTGNVALKTMEGTAKYLVGEVKEAIRNDLLSTIGSLLMKSTITSLKNKMDPRLYNGAILVGLNGVVVKSHGNSDAIGFANAVSFTINILKNNIFDKIKKLLDRSSRYDLNKNIAGG
ncbi:MAG: phosphate acyltransferase PlsX [Holosporaceae bacterium]|nr:phosphate acyltransferase PlsX [Holosporaceae bacterium]